MPINEDFDDVEIFIRKPNGPEDDEEYVWTATYRDMAKMNSRTVIENVGLSELERGPWVIGIRERGDEQYTQRFEVTPLLSDQVEHEIEHRVAALLDHWRQ